MEKSRYTLDDDLFRAPNEVSADLVLRTIAEIFQSAPFRASKQSQHLLRYIVEQTLSGHSESLKERLIGVNVFGRRPDYDTNDDPIVRARAAEVRKRLAQFYLGEGVRCSVRIEIAPGSYHASFTEIAERIPAEPVAQPQSQTVPFPTIPVLKPIAVPEPASEPRSIKRLAIVSLVGLAALCVAWYCWRIAWPAVPIDQFWKPVLDAPSPAVIYSGANAVYMLSADFIDHYKATHHVDALENQGREFVVPITGDMRLGPGDIQAFTNDFITIGDLSANVRVASLLAQHRKRFDLRCGEDVAFSDLRQSPTVLIGAFNNSWTMELTGDLPFVFQHSRDMTIRAQGNQAQTWSPTFTSDGKVTIDYAVVTRMPHAKTGQSLITIAGMTQAGTHAAADFITDPDQLKKLAAIVTSEWPQENLQFVLQTRVVNNIPTSPTIVAAKTW